LDCAFFVSSILLMFGLIKKNHATVKNTLADMQKSGWQKIKKPRPKVISSLLSTKFYQ